MYILVHYIVHAYNYKSLGGYTQYNIQYTIQYTRIQFISNNAVVEKMKTCQRHITTPIKIYCQSSKTTVVVAAVLLLGLEAKTICAFR